MPKQVIPPAHEQAAEQAPPLQVKTIAEALRVSSHTVYAEIKAGRLSSYRIGQGRGTIRVSRTAFIQYLDERGIPAAELAVTL